MTATGYSPACTATHAAVDAEAVFTAALTEPSTLTDEGYRVEVNHDGFVYVVLIPEGEYLAILDSRTCPCYTDYVEDVPTPELNRALREAHVQR